jgi:hypothetical protein
MRIPRRLTWHIGFTAGRAARRRCRRWKRIPGSYKEFALLDEAMSWARHANKGDRVALLIEGDDGTHLDKRDIAAALLHPEAEMGEPEVQARR